MALISRPKKSDRAATGAGLALAYSVKRKEDMKTTKMKRPSMVKSDAFSTRLRDEEDDLEMSAAPASPKEQPPEADDEMEAKRKGPSVPALGMKKMAHGGGVDGKQPISAVHEHNPPEHMMMTGDDDDDRVAMMAAEGGMVDEQELEHASSLAAAIMAKRRVQKLAEGGMIDIEENAEEEPNGFYNQNEDAALKENYDSDMDGIHQPMDSNEMADSREEDEENDHDRSVVGSIRAKMKKRSPISR